MAKTKRFFLIAEWCEPRGSTEQNPSSLGGTGCYYTHYPLHDVDRRYCYVSEAQALRVVAKKNEQGWKWGYKHSLVEVPISALREEAV